MIDSYIATYRKPKIVVSDHRVQFNSKSWQNRLSSLGIPPTFISVYHPQSNTAERVMRELGRLFRSYCSEHHSDWPTYVSYIEWVLNHTVHEATGSIPSELFLQQLPDNPLSALIDFPPGATFDQERQLIMAREIQQSKAESRERRHAEKGEPVQYNTGDLVLVRTHRLSLSVASIHFLCCMKVLLL